MKKLTKAVLIGVLSLGMLVGIEKPVQASTVSLDILAQKASYHTEQQIVGYNTVEKTGFRDVEKTGYQDVQKTGIKEVTKDVLVGRQQVTVPYKKEVQTPVYDWVVNGFYAAKGACFETKPVLNSGGLDVRTANKWYTCASTDKEVKLTQINEKWGKAKVSYVTYADVPKITYSYTVTKNTQAYTKANTNNKLTAIDSKGKKYNVQLLKNTKLTKVDNNWYKASIQYADYKKTGTKWNKQTKSATVYVQSKYVKTTSAKTNVWTKQVKTTDGYFYLDSGSTIRVDKSWKQVGTRTDIVTEYKHVWEDVYENQTVEEPYTYTETEPYTYIIQEPYTYNVDEPIYEAVEVENTTQAKYQSIVNYYRQYRLTKSELFQLFTMAGVKYEVVNGYDQSRYVITAGSNGTYQFTPSTLVELVVFEDHSAINLSYLLLTANKTYNDVKINAGNYIVK